jgi:hypothetical protein
MIRMYISSDLGLRNATEINPKAYFSGCGMHCVLCIRINSGARYHRVTTYLVIGPRPQRACSVFAVRLQCILRAVVKVYAFYACYAFDSQNCPNAIWGSWMQGLKTPCQTEIRDLQIAVRVHQNILRLQVPMHVALTSQVIADCTFSIILCKLSILIQCYLILRSFT